MKRKIVYFIAILLTFSPLILFAQTYEEELRQLSSRLCQSVQGANIRTIAVVDFTDLQGNVTELGRFIAEELSTNLVSTKRGFEVIDRLHLKSIIKEHKLSTSWFLDQKAVEKFGKISGVDAIVTGRVIPFQDSVRVSANVIRTDTARVIAAATGNIPRTSTIERLLKERIETSKLASLEETKKSYKEKVLQVQGFTIKLLGCRAPKGGGTVTCDFIITNNKKDRKLTWAYTSRRTRIFDEFGNEYKKTSSSLANKSGGWVSSLLIHNVPTKASVTFEGVIPEAKTITRLDVYCDDFTVTLRDIPIIRERKVEKAK